MEEKEMLKNDPYKPWSRTDIEKYFNTTNSIFAQGENEADYSSLELALEGQLKKLNEITEVVSARTQCEIAHKVKEITRLLYSIKRKEPIEAPVMSERSMYGLLQTLSKREIGHKNNINDLIQSSTKSRDKK